MGLEGTVAIWGHLWELGDSKEFLRDSWNTQEPERVLGNLSGCRVMF